MGKGNGRDEKNLRRVRDGEAPLVDEERSCLVLSSMKWNDVFFNFAYLNKSRI